MGGPGYIQDSIRSIVPVPAGVRARELVCWCQVPKHSFKYFSWKVFDSYFKADGVMLCFWMLNEGKCLPCSQGLQ